MVALPRPGLDEIDLDLTRAAVFARLLGDDLTPVKVGRFVVRRTAGQGAMGRVYVAHDPDLGRDVALKLIRADEGDRARATRFRQRLVTEARALARLSHPNVVPVFETGTVGSDVYVAMEYVPGPTLRRWLARPRDTDAIAEVFAAAAAGLGAAHDAGLVHRDFKPDNVIVGDDGRVRVLDFGLVADDPQHGETSDDAVADTHRPRAGTPAYLAPEVRRGHAATAASDQYAWALALYEALAGQRPQPIDLADPIHRIPVGLSRRARAPAHVRRLIARALAEDPTRRWPSMHLAAAALVDDPARRRRRRGRLVAVGLGAAAATWAWLWWARAAPCDGLEAQLHDVWDDRVRAEVTAAFDERPEPWAQDVGTRAAAGLDAYADAWLDMRREACASAQVRHEQSRATMQRRVACLQTRRTELQATTERLRALDDATLRRAPTIVASLSPLAACRDAAALDAVEAPDPAIADRVAAIDDQLARARVAARGGDYAQALQLATAATRDATTLDHRPLTARALLQRGRGEVARDLPTAEQTLRDAVWAAEASRQDDLAADGWIRLAIWVGDLQKQTARAQEFLERASAVVERLGRPPALLARLHLARGQVAVEAGDPKAADRWFQAAAEAAALAGDAVDLEIRANEGRVELLFARGELDRAADLTEDNLEHARALYGPHHPKVAQIASNLGTILVSAGRAEAALPHLQAAREIEATARGGPSVRVASSENSLGAAYEALGDLEGARTHYEAAVAIHVAADAAEHPGVASPLTNLGRIASRQGDHEAAAQALRRAIDVVEATQGPEHLALADPLTSLGVARASAADFEGAARAHARALALREAALGDDAVPTAISRHNLADAYQHVGRLDEARRLSEAATRVFDASYPPGHAYRLESTLVRARILLDAHEVEPACSLLEAAIGDAGEAADHTLIERLRAQLQRCDRRSR